MSLRGFETAVGVTQSTSFLDLDFQCQVDQRTVADVERALEMLVRRFGSIRCRVVVRSVAPEHVGLGSKTTLLLAILRVVCAAFEFNVTPDDLVLMSGRGGTSGIGVNVFFRGGFVVDAGHPRMGDTQLAPSASNNCRGSPPVVFGHTFPERWRLHLLLPAVHARIAGQSEVEFFSANAPVPDQEVLKVMAAVYHGLVPSLLDGNIPLLASSLRKINENGFKRREIDGQPGSQSLIDQLTSLGHPCGMSSMGPIVFVIAEDSDADAEADIRRISDRDGASYLGKFECPSTGHLVR